MCRADKLRCLVDNWMSYVPDMANWCNESVYHVYQFSIPIYAGTPSWQIAHAPDNTSAHTSACKTCQLIHPPYTKMIYICVSANLKNPPTNAHWACWAVCLYHVYGRHKECWEINMFNIDMIHEHDIYAFFILLSLILFQHTRIWTEIISILLHYLC